MVVGSIPWWISERRNVGMCPSWLWYVWVYGFLLFWSPLLRLLCNSWLVQWQSADGGSCSTLQGFVSIVFAGGIPIEDCLAGLLHSLGSCLGNNYRQSELPAFVLALCLLCGRFLLCNATNGKNLTTICQPMLKLATQYGYYELFLNYAPPHQ